MADYSRDSALSDQQKMLSALALPTGSEGLELSVVPVVGREPAAGFGENGQVFLHALRDDLSFNRSPAACWFGVPEGA